MTGVSTPFGWMALRHASTGFYNFPQRMICISRCTWISCSSIVVLSLPMVFSKKMDEERPYYWWSDPLSSGMWLRKTFASIFEAVAVMGDCRTTMIRLFSRGCSLTIIEGYSFLSTGSSMLQQLNFFYEFTAWRLSSAPKGKSYGQYGSKSCFTVSGNWSELLST